MSFGRRRILAIALLAGAGVALLLTLALAGAWVRSHWVRDVVERTRWSQTATTDEWWVEQASLSGGVVVLALHHETSLAFVGNFVVGDAAFSNNRTEPLGQQWQHARTQPMPTLGVNGEEPAWLWRLGVGWSRMTSAAGPFGSDRTFVRLHLWLPTMLAGVVTALLLSAARRVTLPLRRARAGLCPSCGYDLRGTPERCPECGAKSGAAPAPRDGGGGRVDASVGA